MSDCIASNLSTFHLSVDERKALKHSLAKHSTVTHNDFVMSVQVKDCIINCLVMQWKSFALELLQDHDFLLIQEQWLVDCQFHLLSFDGFSTLFVSGFDSTKILHPFDGSAIIYLGNLLLCLFQVLIVQRFYILLIFGMLG